MSCNFPFADSRFPCDRLQLTIDHLLDSAVSENTWRTYEAAKINFLFFMYTFGLLEIRKSWSNQRFLPSAISSVQWTAYHAHLYRADYKWNTINQYTTNVRSWLLKSGYPDPTKIEGEPDHTFWTVLKSIKKKLHGDKKEGYPISYSLLHQLYLRCMTRAGLRGNKIDGLDARLAANLWLCFSMMFHGLLRTSEVNAKGKQFRNAWECSRADIALLEATGQTSHLECDTKTSKTNPDPSRQGFVLRLWPTGNAMCPVLALKRLWKLDSSKSPSRPLFDYRTPAERSVNAPVRADRAILTKWITALLLHSGIDDLIALKKFTSHSFRSGAASELAKQHATEDVIRNAGRWKSDAVQVYIETVARNPEALKRIGRMLASSPILNSHF